MKPSIGIIGAGAMGLLYAAHLAKYAHVTLYVRREEQLESLNKNGLHFNGETLPVQATKGISFEKMKQHGIILIAVKSYELEHIWTDLNKIPSEIPLLFIQNGIAHLKFILDLTATNIWAATTTYGAKRLNDFSVEQKGKGKTIFGVLKGSVATEKLNFLQQLADFSFEFSNDIKKAMYEKLLINAAVNPLTAVLGAKNGDLIQNENWRELLHEIVEEVNRALQIDDAMQKVEQVLIATKENLSSMATDVKLNRRTEIDSILLPVIRLLEEGNHPATRLGTLYKLIKGKEQQYV
ncbi:2-dehydropantoate 2-reductase [Listeria sp. ILCC797]|uniref:2-dehydropantoate 2-reductase n=1 Tax=Listeria sp. ILCC797 TaxID=1918333 RepID=UPI000B596FD6|nr:2-dehydropantoate 2-reductase [Listeria sp. ILCC797]